MRAYIFGGSRRNLTKFYQGMWLIAEVITWTLILQGVLPTIFGRVKNAQNSARFLKTFDFDRKYLRNRSTYRKSEKYLINCNSSFIGRKNWWTLVHKPKSYRRACWPSQLNFFRETILRPQGRWRWPLIFFNALDTAQGLLAHTANRVEGPPKILRANI